VGSSRAEATRDNILIYEINYEHLGDFESQLTDALFWMILPAAVFVID
jgi:hypothetical protein